MLFLCSLWGGLSPALKIALEGLPPLAIAGIRFLLAWIGITSWCCVQKIDLLPHRKELLPLFIVGILFTLQIAALNIGAQWTTGGHTIVFLSTNPLFVALLSHFFLQGDRLTTPKIIGLVVAFLGIWIIFNAGRGTDAQAHLKGDLMVDHIQKIQELVQDANEPLLALVDDFEELVQDAIGCDGRGHFLASYDGVEEEFYYNEEYYYIYRVN